MTKSPEAVAQARAMALVLERVNQQALKDGVDLRRLSWEEFSERVNAGFKDKTKAMRHLAYNALGESKRLADLAIQGVAERASDAADVRRAVHENAEALLCPAHMREEGKNSFLDNYDPKKNLYYSEDPKTGAVTIEWDSFDFEYFINQGWTGCPAFEVPASDDFPSPPEDIEGLPAPENFLSQFFHTAIEVALNDRVAASGQLPKPAEV